VVPTRLRPLRGVAPAPASFRDAAEQARWTRGLALARHLADHLAEVPALVFFLQPLIPWGGQDADGPLDIGRLDASVYPAVQNFCLAARSLGLGTAFTTVIRVYGAEVLAALGVPEGRYEVAALIPLGHPTGSFGVAPRKPADAVTHWDRWGDRRCKS
jgi:nitroreductase